VECENKWDGMFQVPEWVRIDAEKPKNLFPNTPEIVSEKVLRTRKNEKGTWALLALLCFYSILGARFKASAMASLRIGFGTPHGPLRPLRPALTSLASP
jgi:hypothetical protein